MSLIETGGFRPVTGLELGPQARGIRAQLRHAGHNISARLRKLISTARSFDVSAHLAVVRAMSAQRIHRLRDSRPGFARRYLGNYLARGLCTRKRAAILANHYRLLNTRMPEHILAQLCDGQSVLWEETLDGRQYSIALACPRTSNFEGDLSLLFREGADTLFTLSFSFAPGSLFALPDSQVMFAGVLQGTKGKFDAIRHATKTLHDVSLPALLLSAAEAMGAEMGVTSIVGVGNLGQLSVWGKRGDAQVFAYDDFWQSLGAAQLPGHLFHLPLPMEEKPLAQIKANHRSRVKRKRLFRSALAGQVCAALRQGRMN